MTGDPWYRATRTWLGDYRHLIVGFVWVALLIPGLTVWKESIVFLIVCSVYANAESSFAAHHAKEEG